ncbi:hypothetical protein MKEN_00913100 [Mycena kentingensis (nom. inval.)]|nr:hypothetical protein MKEN_00913100 [Mycena kentingensis (nom. inval.)]
MFLLRHPEALCACAGRILLRSRKYAVWRHITRRMRSNLGTYQIAAFITIQRWQRKYQRPSLFLFMKSALPPLLILAALTAAVFASDDDPLVDANGQRIIGGYIPRKSLSYLGIAAFGISALIQWIYFFTVKPRKNFLLYLTIGMTTMAIGFALRILFINDPVVIGKYIATTLFILLSPCLFLATDYILLHELVLTFPREIGQRALLIPDRLIVRIFVWSDVSTFLLQSAGGGLSASKNPDSANLGNKIAMVGVILQAVSFFLFSVVFGIFGWRVRKHFPKAWKPSPQYGNAPFNPFSTKPVQDWRILFYAVCITCVGITIRSVFRAVEFAGGHDGPIQTTEAYFYFLDALPLWISMTLFCIIWPTRVLNRVPLPGFSGASSTSTIEMYGPRAPVV